MPRVEPCSPEGCSVLQKTQGCLQSVKTAAKVFLLLVGVALGGWVAYDSLRYTSLQRLEDQSESNRASTQQNREDLKELKSDVKHISTQQIRQLEKLDKIEDLIRNRP